MTSFLDTVRVGEAVAAPSELHTIDGQQSIAAALRKLEMYKVLSLPVVTTTRSSSKYLGTVSAADILLHLLFSEQFISALEELEKEKLSIKDFGHDIDDILQKPVKSLLGQRPESKLLFLVGPGAPLSTVVGHFAQGVHRVLVGTRSEAPSKHRLFSQSDAVRYLRRHLTHELVAPTARLTLEELGLAAAPQTMVTVSANDTALKAFQTLMSTRWTRKSSFNSTADDKCVWDLSALPVLDSKSRVVGTVSQSDLRGMAAENLHELLLPVLSFCEKRAGKKKPDTHHQVTVTPETTIGESISKVVDRRVHRAWIVDDGRLAGVLSLTDILSRFSTVDFSYLSYYQRSRL
uniref:CBS domain-containing protein n=1 Tax=Lotharella oceanica TaxID=641309 RepID=A0A7S2TLT4_9EUKA